MAVDKMGDLVAAYIINQWMYLDIDLSRDERSQSENKIFTHNIVELMHGSRHWATLDGCLFQSCKFIFQYLQVLSRVLRRRSKTTSFMKRGRDPGQNVYKDYYRSSIICLREHRRTCNLVLSKSSF